MSKQPQMSMLGAVASSTGDDFHQLWGMRKVLALLKPHTDLVEVKLEGFTLDEIHNELGPHGQIVDVTTKIVTGNSEPRFHYEQLKYSPSNPDTAWTWSRLLANKSKNRKKSSILARLAQMLLGAGADSTFSIVTNQPADKCIEADVKRLIGLLEDGTELDDKIAYKLRTATGCNDGDLLRILSAWDLSGFGAVSRLKLETEIIQRVGEFTDADARNDVDLLQQRIATLMLPEGMSHSPVTRETVLTWLGGGSSEILFPALSRIQKAQPYLRRSSTNELVELIAQSGLPVRLTAPGGCGKTSLAAALHEELPPGSEVIIYDCYGGGLFKSSDDRRHLPDRALVQVSNDIAARLDIPVMLRRETSGPIAAAFSRRLKLASEILRQRNEAARLVVVFDAADNSVMAAEHWNEACFIQEVVNLSHIPENICLIFSCRDARKASLGSDASFREFALQAFDAEETNAFVGLHHGSWVPNIAETLHELTGGTPRRLAYAVEGLTEQQAQEAINRLMPKAAGIDPLFEKRLVEAGVRIGSPEKIKQVLGVLAYLPRPVPAWVIAELCGLLAADVLDISNDLGGIKERQGGWSFHDEDFEFFARERTNAISDELLNAAADLLFARKSQDAYAARAVGEVLMRTARYANLYDLVRSPSQSSSPLNGIEAKLVRSRRLALAINCCKVAGDLGAACSLLITAADEMKSDRLVNKLLLGNLQLSCKFAPEQTMEIVFSTAYRRRHAGAMRVHLAAACAHLSPLQARENLRWWSAALTDWSQQEKQKRCRISSEEVAAEFIALRQLRGLEPAIEWMLRWKPLSSSQGALTKILVHLAGNGPNEFLTVIEYRGWPPIIRTQLMAAAILAGAPAENQILQNHLYLLASTSPRRWDLLSATRTAEYPHFADAVLTICEYMMSEDDCHSAIMQVLETAFPIVEFKERYEISRFKRYADFYARAIAVHEHIRGTSISVDSYLPEPKEVPRRQQRGSKQYSWNERREKTVEEDWNDAVRVAARQLKRLSTAAGAGSDATTIANALRKGHDEYGYDSDAEAIIRFVTAWLIQNALAGNSLEAPLSACLGILRDWQANSPKNRIAICVALSRVPSAHSTALQQLPQIAAEVEAMAAAASDRSDLMMSCSHAALPMDEELARDFFERAIRLTEKIDVEALSQLELAAVVAEAGIDGSRSERVELAKSLADTASAADATLGMDEHFPWSAVVNGVAAIDLPTGLAVVSQWRDFGTLSHHRSIRYLLSGRAAKVMMGEYRFALSIFAGEERTRLKDYFEEALDVPAAAIHRHCWDALLTGDKSVILDTRWENAVADYIHKADGKTRLREVARKLLEWHPVPESETDEPEQPPSPLMTETEITEALSRMAADKDRISSYAAAAIAQRITPINLRTFFLRKAAEIAGDEGWFGELLVEHLEGWKAYPTVETWAREELPIYIAASLPEHFEWRYSETETLDTLLRLTGLSLHDQALIIFEGIQIARRELHADMIYAFAGLVASRADSTIRAAILREMLSRLNGRLDQRPKFRLATSAAPENIDLCVARTLYSAMADIDREVRWVASHATLVLAQLGCSAVIEHLASLLGKETEDAFSFQGAPFYLYAAQEQLLTTFDRVTVDKPRMIAAVREPIKALTISTPHLIVRELGKRMLLRLANSGHITLLETERGKLERLNQSPFEMVPRPNPVFGRPRDSERKKRQFRFDDTDTIPYWYSTPAKMFNLPFDSFLDRVEAWVHGKWGAVETDSHWLKEPRVERLRNETGNSSHRHGTIPRIERLSRYLEWHGMMHAVGELVMEVPMFLKEEYENSLADWIDDHLPTLPPYWVSDLRTPPPLEPRFWGHDDNRVPDCYDPDSDSKVWSKRVPERIFDEEVGLAGDGTAIVIGSSFKLQQRDGWEDVEIRSGFVTTETAEALGQALLTVRDHMDFFIPPADDTREIAEDGFRLRGWLCSEDQEPKVDKFDGRRGVVYGSPFQPSSKIIRDMGLKFHPNLNGWTIGGASIPALRFDFWGAAEEHSPGSGWRATASSKMLTAMLEKNDMSMILSVEIARGMAGESNYKRQWRIYVVDPSGSLRKIERKRRSLGRYWVRNLGLDHSCDTLLRWRLHRLAELVHNRQAASSANRQSIEAKIGTLWQSIGKKERWDKDWADDEPSIWSVDAET